jgi:Ca2+-binding RTX toxin-like protein
MATPTLIKPISPINNISGLTLTWAEDGAKEGFSNLGAGNDSVSFFQSLVIGNQIHENTTNYKINAQAGNDVITTAAGNDTVYGGSGADTITTGKGADQLYGGSGDDKLFAGQDDDQLYGGSGNDVLDGGSGKDYLDGGTGNDTMTGGSGNDDLNGGTGNDTMAGGSGSDFFFVTLSSGTDRITDFTNGQDKIALGWDIKTQLPDTYAGSFDVAAALLNINVPNAAPGGNFAGDPSAPMLIFNAATQMLSFDADGILGQGAAVDLVQLTGVTQLFGGDFWAGAPF